MLKNWTIQDSLDLYLIDRWGKPYFSINDKGNLEFRPSNDSSHCIDIKELLDDLKRRSINTPILIRFNDILKERVKELSLAFQSSIDTYKYKAKYSTVMPIKVNQQRHVIEQLVRHGKDFNLGLEAGSKPELLVAMALLENGQGHLICNGYKDDDYIETALMSQMIGIKTILVLDRFQELERIIEIAKRLNIRPLIGFRIKLSATGVGRWAESSGDRSKFGLSVREMMLAVDILRKEDMMSCISLLHFHIGSQMSSIRPVKNAVREAARFYCELRKLGCDSLDYIDVGGGLAIDYDGSQSNFHSSMNYSMQEYANDCVSVIMDICDENEYPHPNIISESGRALVAHHALLVFDVLGTNQLGNFAAENLYKPNEDDHNVLIATREAFDAVNAKNLQECLNDILALKEESTTLFAHGVIDIETRARLDELFWATCKKIYETAKVLSYVPEDLLKLQKLLSDTYYCNFSVFQSMPDAWAVGQLFPVCPIHRLNEEPTREAILADLTCDSDGKIDNFIDLRDVKKTIKLHPLDKKPYYLGAFLIGAYQETLGDLHNLFGDTNAVHVEISPQGGYILEHLLEGDDIQEVLSYVEYDRLELIRKVRSLTEGAVRKGDITFEQSAKVMKRYEESLAGYTYLI